MYWMKSKLKKMMIVHERLLGEGRAETTTIDVAVVVAAERRKKKAPSSLLSLLREGGLKQAT